MEAIIQIGDFTGKYSITANGYNSTDLATYIDRYSETYLVEMLGKELFDLFIASTELPTPDPIYLKLKEPFIEQPQCKILNSRGVADMLLGFVYYHWMMDVKTTQTITGGVKIKAENSTTPLNDYGYIFERYNEAVGTYKAIQEYILENEIIYSEFKGIEKSYKMLAW